MIFDHIRRIIPFGRRKGERKVVTIDIIDFVLLK